MQEYLILITGFTILIFGAQFLVDGASSAGTKLGLSQLVIGLTVVAIGTSLPELIINVFASISGKTGLAIGNVIGSNLMNTLLIVGITALIFPIKASRSIYKRDVWINLMAILVLIMLANDFLFFKAINVIDRFDGGILLVMFTYVLYLIFFKSGNEPDEIPAIEQPKHMSWFKAIAYIVSGMAGLYFGGQWIVSSTTTIGAQWGISDSMMGMTVIAVATSLPELVTSIVAAIKKNTDIALGNVLGSNIFNIFLVLGVSATIHPISYETTHNIDLGILFASGLFIAFVIYTGKTSKTITRYEGAVLILSYLVFMIWSIVNAS